MNIFTLKNIVFSLLLMGFLASCSNADEVSETGDLLMENSVVAEEVSGIRKGFEEYLSRDNGKMKYSVKSDSSLYYYTLGWYQIMDEGHYGKAEESYRKSLEFDPDFLIGQAVLGRLTLDNKEREEIYQNVEKKRGSLPADEEELLGVYHDFVQYTNRRESGDATARAFIQEALINAEKIFQKIVDKYPEEPWMKSEYVEFINSNHGPDIALNSLEVLTADRHAENLFLLGFQASLEAERGNFKKALEIAAKIEAQTFDKSAPKPSAVFADIYYQIDSLSIAKEYADRAVKLDARNLDASRLQTKINAAISRAE